MQTVQFTTKRKIRTQKLNTSLPNKTSHVIEENSGRNVIQLQITSSFLILHASKFQLIAFLISFFDFKSYLAIALGHSCPIHWFYCTFSQSLSSNFSLKHPKLNSKVPFTWTARRQARKIDTLPKSRELDNEVENTHTHTHTFFYRYFFTLDFQTFLLVQCFKSSPKN